MSIQKIRFSIIIPTYNRPHELAKCLTSITQQTFSNIEFEVIIVNDGGCPLDEVVSSYRNQFKITVIDQKNAGPASARNRGAAAAIGDYLAFTDDDCCPDQNWLYGLEQACSTHPDTLIGGKTINSLTDNCYSIASQLIVDVAYQYHNPTPQSSQFFASNNMVFPRQRFLIVGGFHLGFRTSEDREICGRWLRHGYPMIYDDSVTIHHAHVLDLTTFWQQHLNYGRGAFYYHTVRSQQGAPPFRPDLSFYRTLLAYPFARFPFPQAMTLAALLGLSQVASAVGYLLMKQRHRETFEALNGMLKPLGDKVHPR